MIGELQATINGWIENWDLLSESWRVGIVVFSLVFGTATVAYIASHIIGALEKRFSKTRNLWDDAVLHAARKPVVAFVWIQGVYWAAEVAYRYSEAEIFSVNEKLLQIGFVWVLVWALLRLVKEAEGILTSPLKMKTPMDYTTVNAVSKLSRAVVIITAVLIAMQSLGYSISGVLAFGGVGGIAVGFAAKDLLANFFGGFIIHLDRPFKVGDWVRSPDRNIAYRLAPDHHSHVRQAPAVRTQRRLYHHSGGKPLPYEPSPHLRNDRHSLRRRAGDGHYCVGNPHHAGESRGHRK